MEALLDKIEPLILSRGPSDTSMDFVATHLQISKRTLYEIFESKEEMVRLLLIRIRGKFRSKILSIIKNSENAMAAMINIFLFHQEFMERVSVKFFYDMDSRYKNLRKQYEAGFEIWEEPLLNSFRLGVRQGVFREDANYEIVVKLLRIQVEALKKMEDNFPSDITIQQAGNAISLGMLRSVASDKGMRLLDKYSDKFGV